MSWNPTVHYTPRTYSTPKIVQKLPLFPSAGTWEEGQEIHLNHQGRNGDPLAPSAHPIDGPAMMAKQMQNPTLNLGY